VHASPPLVARPRLGLGRARSIDAPLVYRAVVARRSVVATARRRVRFRRGRRGVPRAPFARRVLATFPGAVTRDARDRGRARFRRARARCARRGPATGRARGRLGRAFHRTPHPARRPARPTPSVDATEKPSRAPIHADGPEPARRTPSHVSAGLPLRCAPRADRRHPRAKSLS
jgi:hypothetical protein